MASERVKLSGFAHDSILAMRPSGMRSAKSGSFPVAGLPGLRLGLTFIDLPIN